MAAGWWIWIARGRHFCWKVSGVLVVRAMELLVFLAMLRVLFLPGHIFPWRRSTTTSSILLIDAIVEWRISSTLLLHLLPISGGSLSGSCASAPKIDPMESNIGQLTRSPTFSCQVRRKSHRMVVPLWRGKRAQTVDCVVT